VLAVTATIVDACEAAGFACVLTKPIDFEDLIATVRRLLGAA